MYFSGRFSFKLLRDHLWQVMRIHKAKQSITRCCKTCQTSKQTLNSSVPTAQEQTLSFKAHFGQCLNFSTGVWECGMHL